VRADLAVIAVGVCGMTAWLTLLNGIYATIVQVKVPQRFHGRVFAMNTLIAWSTLPIGFGLVAPYAASVLFGVAILAVTLIAMRIPALARFDHEVPDAIADDLVGVQALRGSTTTKTTTEAAP
jgi:hypothetical protein